MVAREPGILGRQQRHQEQDPQVSQHREDLVLVHISRVRDSPSSSGAAAAEVGGTRRGAPARWLESSGTVRIGAQLDVPSLQTVVSGVNVPFFNKASNAVGVHGSKLLSVLHVFPSAHKLRMPFIVTSETLLHTDGTKP